MTTQKTLKNMRSALAALALAGSISGYCADSTVAVSEKPVVESEWANLTAKSAYTTNGGVMFNNNLVLQHDLGVVINGVSVDAWNNYDTKNHQYNEFDFTASKSFDLGFATGSANAGLWTYPHTGYSNAPNVALTVSPKKLPLGLESSLIGRKLWCKESRGVCADLDISRKFNVAQGLSARFGLLADYNNKFYSNQSGLACLNPYVSVTVPITKGLSATAGLRSQRAQPSFKGATNQKVYSLSLDLDLKTFGGRK
jgi:hypothetical protein